MLLLPVTKWSSKPRREGWPGLLSSPRLWEQGLLALSWGHLRELRWAILCSGHFVIPVWLPGVTASPSGRGHQPGFFRRPWSLLLCSSCAAKGTHRCCSALKDSAATWECEDCAGVSTGKRAPPMEPPWCTGWGWRRLPASGMGGGTTLGCGAVLLTSCLPLQPPARRQRQLAPAPPARQHRPTAPQLPRHAAGQAR